MRRLTRCGDRWTTQSTAATISSSSYNRIEDAFASPKSPAASGGSNGILSTDEWEWTPYIAELFGLNPDKARPCFADWEHAIFPDDALKLHAAVDIAEETGAYYTEFRVKHSDGSVHWIAGKGQATQDENGKARWIGGVYYEIGAQASGGAPPGVQRDAEARVVHERAEVQTLETLIRTGAALNAELSLERVVQTLTDAAVDLTGAQYGAFFLNQGRPDKYELYALSGAPREAFANSRCRPRPRSLARPFAERPSSAPTTLPPIRATA